MIFTQFNWTKHEVLELDNASEAYLYFRSSRLNLITGFPEVYPLENFLNELDQIDLDDEFSSPVVIHTYYELGLILAGLGHSVKPETPLAIRIDYSKARIRPKRKSRLQSVPLKSLERPSWSEYKGAFDYVQEKLLSGECYQVNLTYPYDFVTEEVFDPRDLSTFLMSAPGASAYAHATYWGEKFILSNSPECLFEYKNKMVSTRPIKGTMARKGNWKKTWSELLKTKKEESELIMITDLLKNDLNRLSAPEAKVLKLRAPLLVPGLVHQFSLIQVKLKDKVSLLKTLQSLFPGGSITGAPKKKVMEIIQQVERYERGVYCGSTILLWKKRKSASINIRTAEIDLMERIWRIGAGGGVTLLSSPVGEFQEMESKVKSFLTLLKAPGY
jgi:para-aminobenzoate synthetase component I